MSSVQLYGWCLPRLAAVDEMGLTCRRPQCAAPCVILTCSLPICQRAMGINVP
jgi:hypothetical protein